MEYMEYVGIDKQKINDEFDYYRECLDRDGYFVIENVFSPETLNEARSRLDQVWEAQLQEFGGEFLTKINDFGVCRAPMIYDKFFYNFITDKTIDSLVEKILGPGAILHLQNGIIVFPEVEHHQKKFHKDFAKSFCASEPLSLNTFIMVDDFTENNGATWIVPGSHKFSKMPSDNYIESHKTQLTGRAGSLFVFDSTLWHAAGQNFSKSIRRGLNLQFTKAFIKQQMDYPAFVMGVDMESRLAQRLGFWSIPPKGPKEFRVADPAKRTYRAGQG